MNTPSCGHRTAARAGSSSVPTFEVLAAAFAAEGTSTLFTLLGDGNMHFAIALAEQHGARLIHVRHEHNAVAGAMGHASATDGVGVAGVACGPGLTQLGTALVSAARNRIPLVVFAGETPLGALWHNQSFAPEPFAAACGARCIAVRSPEHARARVREAFHTARNERVPVILSVPIDVQRRNSSGGTADTASFAPMIETTPAPLPVGAAERLAERLLGARHPVLLAGRGALAAGTREALVALADRLSALMTATLLARGLFDDHPYSIGICGGFATDVARETLAKADLICAFGASLNSYTLAGGAIAPHADILSISLEPKVVCAGRTVFKEAYRADAAVAARAILDALGSRQGRSTARTEALAQDLRERPADATEFDIEPGRIDPRIAFAELERVLPGEFDMISGAGHQGYFHTVMRGGDPRKYHAMREFGAVGNGLGQAIGVAVTRQDGGTVLFEGDGGLWMHLQELETIARHRLKLLLVICNDGGFGAEIHHLRHDGIEPGHAMFGHGDLSSLARAFGIDGRKVDGPGQIAGVVRDYLSGARSMLIDIQASDRVLSPMFRRRLQQVH